MNYNSLPGYGKDNWIKFKWNRTYENPYPKNDFECFLRPVGSSRVLPFDVATNNAIIDIYETYNKKIYLAMSGGVDGEYIANSLFKLKIDFTPIIVTLNKENSLDTWWAFRWCKNHNIEPHIINIDEDQYVNLIINNGKKYCSIMSSGTVTTSVILEYVNKKNGTLLTGMGFNELYIPDPIMHEEELDKTLYNEEGKMKEGYLQSEVDILKIIESEGQHPITVLNWNPEITLSYIAARDPNLTTEENRFKIYNCLPRPKMGLPIDIRKTYRINKKYKNFAELTKNIGTTKSYYLGTTEQLIDLLSNGIIE
jgi:hypothetical protein